MRICDKCGASWEDGETCPNCGYSPLRFSMGDLSITLLSADGVRIPASNLFYSHEGCILVGELTYAHAFVQKTVKKGDEEKVEEKETIEPVLIWALHGGGGVERFMKPLQMAKTVNVADRTVMVELKTRSAAVFDTLIDLDVAKEFVEGKGCIEWGEAFTRVKDKLKKYVSFGWDPRLYDVVSCWVLGTYFVEIFTAYPFLYPYGSQGSGKTRLLYTATRLSRHGFVATDPSDAALYRTAEAFRPTMGIDESLLGEQAWKIIRTAFKRGTKVPRVEKTSKDEFVLGLFETYMPVCFASTRQPTQLGGEEADEARAIFVYMQQEDDPIGRDPEVHDFHDLRNELYLVRMLRPQDVLQALRREENTVRGFKGHEREVWLPIFTMASIVGADIYENVRKYADEANALKRLSAYQEEKTIIGAMVLVFRSTLKESLEKERYIEFKASDLLPHVATVLDNAGEYDEDGFKKYWTPRRVGRILKKMSLFRRLLHGRTTYTVTAKNIGALIVRYEWGRGGIGGIGGHFGKGMPSKQGENIPPDYEESLKTSEGGISAIPPQSSVSIDTIEGSTRGGLDDYTDNHIPSPECPPIPPSPPNNASLSEDLLVVVEVLKGLQRRADSGSVKAEEWCDALGWGDVRFSSVVSIVERDGKVFQTTPGFWRATI